MDRLVLRCRKIVCTDAARHNHVQFRTHARMNFEWDLDGMSIRELFMAHDVTSAYL